MLHNFAGNIEMYGILDSIAFGPVEARTSENTTMASLFNVFIVPQYHELLSKSAIVLKP